MNSPCPTRTTFAESLLRANPLKCEVAFANGVEQCAYERRDVNGWHQVRRSNGHLELVHENQIEEKFRNWLSCNEHPYGRYTP